MIPFFSSEISAGHPFISDDSIDQVLHLEDLVVTHPAATFYIRVKGNSMCDLHILSGDILVVNRALTPRSGDVIVALLDGQFTVKQLTVRDKQIWLCAANRDYRPIRIEEGNEFQVWGVVTYVIHKMDFSRRLQ